MFHFAIVWFVVEEIGSVFLTLQATPRRPSILADRREGGCRICVVI